MRTLIITLFISAFTCVADEVLTRSERVIALTILGEARGEGEWGMFAVGCVIQNRARERNLSPAEVCLQPWQFSVWNAGRGKVKKERELYHLWKSPSMQYARTLSRWINNKEMTLGDITDGANHYCHWSINPSWIFKIEIDRRTGMKTKVRRKAVASIGRHLFYKLP